MESPISKLKKGMKGKIARFTDEMMAGKLMCMGVLPGSLVKVIRKAPFHGGFYLKIDGYNMVLREQEAANIVLTMEGKK
ncbi:MAG TPA: ferrous iron transport protein A [Bacteroidetes bacterium]|nr:ferrous iron transport protein A [Bacteroidota bacterium]